MSTQQSSHSAEVIVSSIRQPKPRSTIDAIDTILKTPGMMKIDVAAAYVTSGGISTFFDTLHARGAAGNRVEKRWITSFDYLRTEPTALRYLMSVGSSMVRIYGADECLRAGGIPSVPFHPKALLFQADPYEFVLAGSGNISYSGLRRGIEAGIVVGLDRSVKNVHHSAENCLDEFRSYFDSLWGSSEILTSSLLSRYSRLYERSDNLVRPVPTEDDIASSDRGNRALSSDSLVKLRACRFLWIEAGNITKNRGNFLPGNQLMMKRMTRVFFGYPATDRARDSQIGKVILNYGGKSDSYSLTYSNNGMDKLVLPIPGDGGPDGYDNEVLLFEQVAPKEFKLKLGTSSDRDQWRLKSIRIGGHFKMSSGGREWGVF